MHSLKAMLFLCENVDITKVWYNISGKVNCKMARIQGSIRKILKALEIKGYIYLLNKEQVYSRKMNKVCNLYKLFYLMPVEEYNKKHPDKKKDVNKYEYVKTEVLPSFRQQDILFQLIDIYKKVGEINE